MLREEINIIFVITIERYLQFVDTGEVSNVQQATGTDMH